MTMYLVRSTTPVDGPEFLENVIFSTYEDAEENCAIKNTYAQRHPDDGLCNYEVVRSKTTKWRGEFREDQRWFEEVASTRSQPGRVVLGAMWWRDPAARTHKEGAKQQKRADREQRSSSYRAARTHETALLSGTSPLHFAQIACRASAHLGRAVSIADQNFRFDARLIITPATSSDRPDTIEVQGHLDPPGRIQLPIGTSAYAGDLVTEAESGRSVGRIQKVRREPSGTELQRVGVTGPCGEQWTARLITVPHLRAEVAASTDPVRSTELRMLHVSVNNSTEYLDLEMEQRKILDALERSKHGDQFRLHPVPAATAADVVREVSNKKPRILHFSGHGDKHVLCLRDSLGAELELFADDFRDFLEGRGIELLVLNSCYSDTTAALAEPFVSAIVGTTDEVDDEEAADFSFSFYQALGDGHTIQQAFDDARDAVLMAGGDDVFRLRGTADTRIVPQHR